MFNKISTYLLEMQAHVGVEGTTWWLTAVSNTSTAAGAAGESEALNLGDGCLKAYDSVVSFVTYVWNVPDTMFLSLKIITKNVKMCP